MTAFRGMKSSQLAPLLNSVVSPEIELISPSTQFCQFNSLRPYSSILYRKGSSFLRKLWFLDCRKSHFSSLAYVWYVPTIERSGLMSALVVVALLALGVFTEAH